MMVTKELQSETISERNFIALTIVSLARKEGRETYDDEGTATMEDR
jgi:hypothetical protein